MRSTRWRNVVAVALLTAALVLFVAYHLTPSFDNARGWEIWVEIADAISEPGLLLDDPEELIVIPSFITLALLLSASPWVIPFLRKSRALWWIAVILSSAACVCISGYLLILDFRGEDIDWTFGARCLFLAPLVHLAGLLVMRGEKPEAVAANGG